MGCVVGFALGYSHGQARMVVAVRMVGQARMVGPASPVGQARMVGPASPVGYSLVYHERWSWVSLFA
jgi:hypothetical protein